MKKTMYVFLLICLSPIIGGSPMSGQNGACAMSMPCRSNQFCRMQMEAKCNRECSSQNCASQRTACSSSKCGSNQPTQPMCMGPMYKLDADGKCVDVDECENSPCPSTHECVNKVGSYFCKRVKCYPGLQLVGNKCQDIDECSANPGVCGPGGTCSNIHGDFACQCKAGFTRDAATKKCVDRNECDHRVCTHKCTNTEGSFMCSCPQGYTSIGRHCRDINECMTNPCPQGLTCFNTFGGHECIAPAKCPDKCVGAPVVSSKWRATAMTKTVRPKNYQFRYGLTGFADDCEFHFYFESGNEDMVFYLHKVAKSTVVIMNARQIEGPKKYTLRLHGDVLQKGRLVSRYVYVLYVFVGAYNF